MDKSCCDFLALLEKRLVVSRVLGEAETDGATNAVTTCCTKKRLTTSMKFMALSLYSRYCPHFDRQQEDMREMPEDTNYTPT
jgi:hypothetical protein